MKPHSIATINDLPQDEKDAIYRKFIPRVLLEKFSITENFLDPQGRNLLRLECDAETSNVILDLRHEVDAPDPLLYAHLTDTMYDQIHVLLYGVNDPNSPRFDVDRMPDGTPTSFGVFKRNIPAEIEAFKAGLAPGQVRRGLRILRYSIASFEEFVQSLNHDLFFVEPLAYHNAIVFERYGFKYQQGKRLMEQIHRGFQPGGEFFERLDGSSPFREPGMCDSIRCRSWAIHDGILGMPFHDVTMYKRVGEHAGVDTYPDGVW
ncbi:MAG: hypothetical protein JSV37_11530 [Anaerolineaceae bacterium]|nr:MAG: hypothetical protein JSV37_11530 [Anaerolineaceae bacterium]